jgi:hypothetical protein
MNIIQEPLYRMVATDEEIIFAVQDIAIAATKIRVKYIAEVYISSYSTNPFSQLKIATLKTIPNDTGTGIFDFSRVLEAYVSPDYLGGITTSAGTPPTQYYTKSNGIDYSNTQPHTIHEIDKHSINRNACKLFGIKFYLEYADAIGEPLQNTLTAALQSRTFYIHNAVRQEDDLLAIDGRTGIFGYNYAYNDYVLNVATYSGDTEGKFLTNAPTIQYIGDNDFHTIAYFNQSDEAATLEQGAGSMFGLEIGGGTASGRLVKRIYIQFYYNGVQTGATIDYTNAAANGSIHWQSGRPQAAIQYTGVGTGNINNCTNSGVPALWDYYTVSALSDASAATVISKVYYFYRQEVCKGFEKFRLTWLNRLGVWDYFNFTKKNVRKVNSKRSTYQQIKGSWNEDKYIKHGYKGGKKVFSTNSKEVVTLQTDFITEEAAEWLEELFTSPEVFVLQERNDVQTEAGLQDCADEGERRNIINKYVQPCIITTSSYTRKTTANDKLKQYTVEIEMSHNKRIQKA